MSGDVRFGMIAATDVQPSEYQVCQKRGHVGSGYCITEGFGITWSQCVHCGVRFRTVEQVVEHDNDLDRLERLEREPEENA